MFVVRFGKDARQCFCSPSVLKNTRQKTPPTNSYDRRLTDS
jgi:hypothetical protein